MANGTNDLYWWVYFVERHNNTNFIEPNTDSYVTSAKRKCQLKTDRGTRINILPLKTKGRMTGCLAVQGSLLWEYLGRNQVLIRLVLWMISVLLARIQA